MTTSVLIGVQGNKACQVVGPNGTLLMMPGTWTTLTISGDQKVEVSEGADVLAVSGGIAIKSQIDAAVAAAAAAPVAPSP